MTKGKEKVAWDRNQYFTTPILNASRLPAMWFWQVSSPNKGSIFLGCKMWTIVFSSIIARVRIK